MMKSETKAKWLEALRSGTYEQTESVLNNGAGGFCCLGVLHDVTGGSWHTNRHGEICTGSKKRQNSNSEMLEGRVFLQGLHDSLASELADLNDRGRTFNEIAKVIEEKVKAK